MIGQNTGPKAAYIKLSLNARTALVHCRRRYPTLREIETLKYIYYVRPGYRGHNFYHDCENKFVRQVSAFLKKSVVTIFCRSEIIVEISTVRLEFLKAMEITESWAKTK